MMFYIRRNFTKNLEPDERNIAMLRLVYSPFYKLSQSTLPNFDLPHSCWITFYFKVPNYHHSLNFLSTFPPPHLCYGDLSDWNAPLHLSYLEHFHCYGGNRPCSTILLSQETSLFLSQAEFICRLFSDHNLTLYCILAVIISGEFLFIFPSVSSVISCQLFIQIKESALLSSAFLMPNIMSEHIRF